jgi:hypothetical protein
MNNFFEKHIQLFGLLLLGLFTASAAAIYFEWPARFQSAQDKPAHACPIHGTVSRNAHGENCATCEADAKHVHASGAASSSATSADCCATNKNTKLPAGHPPVTAADYTKIQK